MKKLLISVILLTVLCIIMTSMVSCGEGDAGSAAEALPNKEEFVTNNNESSDSDKIIKTGTVNAETKTFDESLESLEALINDAGGRVQSSSITKNSSYKSSGMIRTAHLTVRVPVDSFETFINDLGKILNVTRVNTSSENVSEEYYDTQAILQTLNKKRDSLLTLLTDITPSSNWDYYWQISDELDKVEMQIAKVTATLKDLESKTSYSTLNITVTEVSTLTDTQPEEDSFWSNIKEAFSTGINFFAEVFQVIVIAIVFLMPVIVIAAIVLAVILIIRYRRKKKNGDNGEQN